MAVIAHMLTLRHILQMVDHMAKELKRLPPLGHALRLGGQGQRTNRILPRHFVRKRLATAGIDDVLQRPIRRKHTRCYTEDRQALPVDGVVKIPGGLAAIRFALARDVGGFIERGC